MGLSVAVFAALPWLDRSKVKSIRYRGPLFKISLVIFLIAFLILGYLGTQAPTDLFKKMGVVCTIIYFAFFALFPWITSMDKTKPVPERVTFK